MQGWASSTTRPTPALPNTTARRTFSAWPASARERSSPPEAKPLDAVVAVRGLDRVQVPLAGQEERDLRPLVLHQVAHRHLLALTRHRHRLLQAQRERLVSQREAPATLQPHGDLILRLVYGHLPGAEQEVVAPGESAGGVVAKGGLRRQELLLEAAAAVRIEGQKGGQAVLFGRRLIMDGADGVGIVAGGLAQAGGGALRLEQRLVVSLAAAADDVEKVPVVAAQVPLREHAPQVRVEAEREVGGLDQHLRMPVVV